MYNSLIVSIFAWIWKWILYGYEYSVIKKIVDSISKFVTYLFKGSIVAKYFKSEKDFIKETYFYKIYSKLIDIINKILDNMNKYIKKIGKSSLFYRDTNNFFNDETKILGSLFVFFFALGLGLIGNNLIRGFYSGKSYLVGIILIIGSLIGYLLKENYIKITNNSWIYNFVTSIFLIDEEGGENWW